jgi:hypothetical protein
MPPNNKLTRPAAIRFNDNDKQGSSENQFTRPGQVQRLTCYPTRVVEAAPGGRVNRMQRMGLDPGNQIADRPPAPSTSDAIPERLTSEPTPHS